MILIDFLRVMMKLNIYSNIRSFFYKLMPSPDGNGILLLFSLKSKRYSGQLEIAPKNKFAF